MDEQWNVIDGYEGRYAVSSYGNVKRTPAVLKTLDGRPSRWAAHSLLCANVDRYGYHAVCLWNRHHRNRDRYRVHQLVMRYFGSPPPSDKHEINHIDGDKSNNHIDNIEWVTHAENIKHSFARGHRKAARGERAGGAKLKAHDIPLIRQMVRKGVPLRQIAREYGVTHQTIAAIRDGKTWAHIE